MNDASNARAEHPRLTLFLMVVLIALIFLAARWALNNGHGQAYLDLCYGAGLYHLWRECRNDGAMRTRTLLVAAAAPVTMPIFIVMELLEIGEHLIRRGRKRAETRP